ncbi:MAG: tetraacyldisaccharide 4'-kinase [Acidobacteriota bacterium]
MSTPRIIVASASRLLETVNAFALGLYRVGVRSVHRSPVPVVSVGNLAAGGTGKTPLVVALARELAIRGRRPAILTRGYRRRGREPVFLAPGQERPWDEVGDEPALIAQAVPGVPIVVDADRVRGASTAVVRAGAGVVVLDDGFQHWRLARDLDVVTVDVADPLCTLAPRREPPRALGRAHAVVITNADRGDVAAALALLRPFAPRASYFACAARPTWLHRGDVRVPATTLAGVRVVAVAGIAVPERFFASLRDLGAEVVAQIPRPDHHVHTPAEVTALLREAKAANAEVVMTAKDVVKLSPLLAGAVAWLEVETVFREGSVVGLLALLPPRGGLESGS